MAPSNMRWVMPESWRSRDDVYQVGQLIGMLVKGCAIERLRNREIRTSLQRPPQGNHLSLHWRAPRKKIKHPTSR